jgi:hypothetical protein
MKKVRLAVSFLYKSFFVNKTSLSQQWQVHIFSNKIKFEQKSTLTYVILGLLQDT